MPGETIKAYRSTGKPEPRLQPQIAAATKIFSDLKGLGIDMAAVADQLEREGVKKFIRALRQASRPPSRKRRIKLKAS